MNKLPRGVSHIFSIALALSALSSGLFVSSATAQSVAGDITGNGQVNIADVQCIVLSVLDLDPEDLSTNPSCLAPDAQLDVNCSGEANVVDVQN